jgi:hypothetical protein
LQAIDKAAKAEVEEAVQQAKESPEPDLKDFWTDIYVRSFRARFHPLVTTLMSRFVFATTVQGHRATFHAWEGEGGGPPLLFISR